MRKQPRLALVTLLTVLAGLFLAGCSGIDDLCVINRYPFAIVVRQKGGKTLTVPTYTTLTFRGAGGYKGNGLDAIQIEDTHRKVLEIVSQYSPNVEQQSKNSLNGSKIWNVMVGPVPAAPTIAPFKIPAKPFSIVWLFAGVGLFIAWIEWRAHRNAKRRANP